MLQTLTYVRTMSLEWQNANGERSSSCPLSAVLEGQTQKAHHYAWLVSQALWALTHSSRVYRWNRQAYIQFRVLASRGRQPSVRVWQAGTYLVSESSFADGMQTRGDTLKAIRKQLSLSSLLLSDTMVILSRELFGLHVQQPWSMWRLFIGVHSCSCARRGGQRIQCMDGYCYHAITVRDGYSVSRLVPRQEPSERVPC